MATRTTFDQALSELKQEILRMGFYVEESVSRAVESLVKQDLGLAQSVIDGDVLIDDQEMLIEDKCLKLIATQQPLAKDLRRIAVGLMIITDLERMGDLACDIAKSARRIANEPLIKPLIDIPRMAQLAQIMVKEALDAYVRGDVQLALKMAADDELVDDLHNQVFRELLVLMMENPKVINQATALLFASRHLERIADHATNIGERIVYLVTGERKELN
ncbi:phosphate signaling complex protein PhoU [Pelotomaculum terephthalicicum JT]|uniref:phosphate signaling complex protein PhoU n=1 Tax=Pelotomaculum terephthalicicum TaxID=206393 RepID=UPI001F03CAA4|nr:phosphate signaling complex protein PhoU [Pelotomaculum terephthalicicum]MCG9968327.1 phosphate signaling complex protein PhoU [Pelotomaculum terephthalicicum JT]